MHLKHKMAAAIVAALAMAVSSGIDAAPRTPSKVAPATTPGLMASPSDCDPFSDWDNDLGTTNNLLPGPSGSSIHRHRAMSGAAAQVIGTTPEAIHRNFMKVVTDNLANAGTASRVARLSDKELAAIARHAAQGTPAARAGLLKLFATRLDARALVRVARAFGRAPTAAAVHAYADKSTREGFDQGVAGLMAPDPDEGGGGGGGGTTSPAPPRPTIDMTLEEIYLEFRTAPLGGLSVEASLAETAMFVGRYLRSPAGWGVAAGTTIHFLIEEFDPGLDDDIGGTIDAMIENFWEAADEVQQGHFEAAFDSLFGFPVTSSSDPWGDWDISDPMMFYYQSTDTCGW